MVNESIYIIHNIHNIYIILLCLYYTVSESILYIMKTRVDSRDDENVGSRVGIHYIKNDDLVSIWFVVHI